METLLTHLFDHSVEVETLEHSIREAISPILIHGSEHKSARWALRALAHRLKRPLILLFEDDYKAKTASEEMEDAVFLPMREIVWFEAYAHSKEVDIQRVEALIEAMRTPNVVLCMSAYSALYRYPPVACFREARVTLSLDADLDFKTFQRQLFQYGYERVELVESKGQYSVRGGIIDVFSPASAVPYRIEFFGDEVDSIRSFDIETQKSLENKRAVTVYPAREMVISEALQSEAQLRVKAASDAAGGVRRERLEAIFEQLSQGTYIDAADRFFPLFFQKSAAIIDFFDAPIIGFMGGDTCVQRIEQNEVAYQRQFSEYLERGEVVAEQFERFMTKEAFLEALHTETVLISELIVKKMHAFAPQQIVKFASREMNAYHGKFDQLAGDIRKWQLKGYRIVILFQTQDRLTRFTEALSEMDVFVNTQLPDRVVSGQAVAFLHPLSSGFYFDTFKTVVITEKEIFGEGRRIAGRRTKRGRGKEIKALSELSLGDYVVHEAHGIGRYVGIEQMKIDQTRKDFLKIQYANGDNLYIPVESSGLIQKYMGTDVEKIKLNRLGGAEWKRTKFRAKKAIEDITDTLIELYAKRQNQKGFAFSEDSTWQREFEAQFPYEETPDQLKCIEEIKTDMEADKPMERLLCGDVGYGKTEVALRAAFKAVLDSKQVAILVPTTILAQQHYNNIVERFSKYPANIQMLSRFKTKQEQKDIVESIRIGSVDVIIGTHRLLSSDVIFKNLGLLIIDEEQRFGVKHKERIKQLKEHIDVLTLTATPIPRTLHMSMLGIRDMSVIEDPPEDRYPIQTYVVEEDPYLMREAIVRELERGGQVYYVHNRVSDIDRVTARLAEQLPGARIRYAHGQMDERKLEQLMLDFMNHTFDVLVCTTIIETGLDIANVNTILIDDGDRFGLSQLYQLRGRVGRSNRLAYCYIFYGADKVLTEVAEKRLKAIKEFTELGAGFKIAMRDLEIRGAGNILGTEQHGYMEAIGYELYCKLLEESILTKKGEVVKETFQTRMDFAVDAYIPETYITHHQMKVEIYKKIADVSTREARENVYEEIEDRFGTVPESVDNLLSVAYVKAMCEQLGVEQVTMEGSRFILRFLENAELTPLFISKVLAFDSKNITFFAGTPNTMKIKITNPLRKQEEALKALEKCMESIYSFHSDYVNA